MFPFYDQMGHVVGFTGRIIDSPSTSSGAGAGIKEQGQVAKQVRDDYKPAKYLNSPETEVFRKGKLLYGLRQAQTEIVRKGRVNLVEGNLDVIRFHKQGLKNTICTSGTALTEDHARIIRRFTDNVVLILDGDSAGAKATVRMVEIFLEQGLNVYAALMPQGEDPDTFAKGKSAEELERWIEDNEKDFVMLKIGMAAKNIDERCIS